MNSGWDSCIRNPYILLRMIDGVWYQFSMMYTTHVYISPDLIHLHGLSFVTGYITPVLSRVHVRKHSFVLVVLYRVGIYVSEQLQDI